MAEAPPFAPRRLFGPLAAGRADFSGVGATPWLNPPHPHVPTVQNAARDGRSHTAGCRHPQQPFFPSSSRFGHGNFLGRTGHEQTSLPHTDGPFPEFVKRRGKEPPFSLELFGFLRPKI